MDSATVAPTRSADARGGAYVVAAARASGASAGCTCSSLPGLLYFLIFRYLPLLGNIIAFQDYSPFLGFNEPVHRPRQLRQPCSPTPTSSWRYRTRSQISLLQLILFFPAPIALALLLNSMMSERPSGPCRASSTCRTSSRWVIIIALWQQMFGGAGLINQSLRESWAADDQHHEQPRLLQAAGGTAS